MLVSLLTLAVFMYQTNLIRQQQYKSVYPYLELSNVGTGSMRYTFIIRNNGIGPALIDSIRVVTESGRQYGTILSFLYDYEIPRDSIWWVHSTLNKGSLIAPGESLALVQLVNSELLATMGIADVESGAQNDLSDSRTLHGLLNNDSVTIQVRYRSIYDETWVTTLGEVPPVRED
ncbi:MAG TPA: hypothetical protein DCR93_01895 [Cytophagales bacterium]|nr:hypothetical protein [Cytophagales bacterium]HAP58304.1 hypothetical protein [Cytophagales bacterium]